MILNMNSFVYLGQILELCLAGPKKSKEINYIFHYSGLEQPLTFFPGGCNPIYDKILLNAKNFHEYQHVFVTNQVTKYVC